MRHVEKEIAKRKAVDACYRRHLEGVPGLQLNAEQPGVKHNYGYFPVIFDPEKFGADRNRVFAALEAQGILARKYFYPLTSAFSAFRGRFDPAETPTALRISENVLTLPMYADLEAEDVDRICEAVLGARG